MKKRILTLLVVCCSVALASGQAAKEAKVLALAKKKFEWMVKRNTDSLGAVLDDRLRYIHSNGMVQTRQDVLDDLKGKLTYQSIDTRDLEVRVFDYTAVVTGKGKFTGTNGSNNFAIDLLFTEVYVLKNRSWYLVSRQATKLQ